MIIVSYDCSYSLLFKQALRNRLNPKSKIFRSAEMSQSMRRVFQTFGSLNISNIFVISKFYLCICRNGFPPSDRKSICTIRNKKGG
ncbi:Uncharacterized protein dnm_023780 [Desulfonema magnum]|uniref:Uncharacterized protein n=1 Tax=Desulfonema magnum TaxID=45655 RepID=A0A975GM75_9BACT|nr:Uncharacterized protein dnm_023780 [Desulfonema magnum]